MRETDLLAQLRNPATSDRAFSHLLDMYQERLYWHIRKIVGTHEDAADVLQNCFIKVHRSIHGFQERSSLLTWMYRIAYNESLRHLKKSKRMFSRSLDDVQEHYLQALKDDPYFNGDEVQLKLNQIIAGLTEKQQRVFQMKYFDELSFREISEITGIGENTLKSSYYSAVKIIEEKVIL